MQIDKSFKRSTIKIRTRTVISITIFFLIAQLFFSGIIRLHAETTSDEKVGSETIVNLPIFLAPIVCDFSETSCTVKIPETIAQGNSQEFQLRINSAPIFSKSMDREFHITDLASGTEYKIDYLVYEDGNQIGVSSTTKVITIPDAPSFLAGGQVNDNSVDLYWSDTSGAFGYHIYRDQKELISSHPASETSTNLTNLVPGDTLNLQIVAFNDAGVSVFSESTIIKVPAINLEISEITQTSATLSWSSVKDALSYGIIISDSFNSRAMIGPLDVRTTSYVIASGTPGEFFSVQIVASMTIDDLVISREVRSQLIPETPIEPWISKVGNEKYLLKWFPVMGTDYYKVFMNGINPISQIPAPCTEAIIELPANSDREIQLSVIAANKSGESPNSPPLKIRLNYDELIELEQKEKSIIATSSTPISLLEIGETIPNFSLLTSTGSDFDFYQNTSKCQLFMFLEPGNSENEKSKRAAAKSLIISAGMEGLPIIHIKSQLEEPIIGSKEYPSGYYFNSLNDAENLVADKIFKIQHRPTIVLVDKSRRVVAIDTVSSPENMIPRIMEKVSKLGYCNNLGCVVRYKLITNFKKLHKEEN